MKYIVFLKLFLCTISSSYAQNFNKGNNFIGIDYRSFQSSVKNQAVPYTSTAFAIIAALEAYPNMPKDLSEKYLYLYQKEASISLIHPISSIQSSLRFLSESGVVEEKEMPYYVDSKQVRLMTKKQFDSYLFGGDLVLFTNMMKHKDKSAVCLLYTSDAADD